MGVGGGGGDTEKGGAHTGRQWKEGETQGNWGLVCVCVCGGGGGWGGVSPTTVSVCSEPIMAIRPLSAAIFSIGAVSADVTAFIHCDVNV